MCLWGFVMSECFVTLRWCPIQIQAKCPFKHHNTIYVNCSWDLNMKPFLEVPVIMEPLLSRWHHISVFLLPPASYYGLKVCMAMPLVFSHCVCMCTYVCVMRHCISGSIVCIARERLTEACWMRWARWMGASFRSHGSCCPCCSVDEIPVSVSLVRCSFFGSTLFPSSLSLLSLLLSLLALPLPSLNIPSSFLTSPSSPRPLHSLFLPLPLPLPLWHWVKPLCYWSLACLMSYCPDRHTGLLDSTRWALGPTWPLTWHIFLSCIIISYSEKDWTSKLSFV